MGGADRCCWWSGEIRMGLVQLNSLVIMAIDDSQLLACHGQWPAAHHLINFFECPADIIVNVRLWGKGTLLGLFCVVERSG